MCPRHLSWQYGKSFLYNIQESPKFFLLIYQNEKQEKQSNNNDNDLDSIEEKDEDLNFSKIPLIVEPEPYQFADPCPESMRHVRIGDLSSVDINWKMLTLARPTDATDENIFSR